MATTARRDRQRGAAAVEFAILLPLLVGLLAGITDFGVALNTARNTTSSLRAAARQGAAVGTARGADYTVLLALAAATSRSEGEVARVVVYRATADGTPPEDCFAGSVAGLCNSYDGSVLQSLSQADFDAPNCVGDLDAAWCPTTRKSAIDAGDRLGVAVLVQRSPMLGNTLGIEQFTRHAVFRLEVGPA
jgi:Flp pilus assembly pilin Flp